MTYNPNIPKDPKENLGRLQSIRDRWERQMSILTKKRDDKLNALAALDEDPDAKDAAFLKYKMNEDIDELQDQIDALQGKLDSNEKIQDQVRRFMRLQEEAEAPLTQKPFASLGGE